MKKSLSILFIITLLFEIIFVPAAYFSLRKIITNKAWLRIEKSHSGKHPVKETTLTFHIDKVDNNPDLQFIHSKEFRYKGEMYDIIRKETLNDSIKFHCYHDIRETRLFAAVETIVKQSIGIDYSNEGKTFRQINLKFPADQFLSKSEIINDNIFKIIEYGNSSFSTLQNLIEVPNPPPRYFS